MYSEVDQEASSLLHKYHNTKARGSFSSDYFTWGGGCLLIKSYLFGNVSVWCFPKITIYSNLTFKKEKKKKSKKKKHQQSIKTQHRVSILQMYFEHNICLYASPDIGSFRNFTVLFQEIFCASRVILSFLEPAQVKTN
jgi:hypothetical protein